MKKLKYDGLTTQRHAIEAAVMKATSQAKVKVKTENATTPWEEREVEDPLATSITTELPSTLQ